MENEMCNKFLNLNKIVGMNNAQLHHEQMMTSLYFLQEVNFSSADILQQVALRKTKGFAKLLEKMGLVTSRKVAAGLVIYGLTKLGADHVGGKKFDILKVGLSRTEHSLCAQRETLVAIDRFGVIDFHFESKLDWFGNGEVENLRTDVAWEREFVTDFLVEIELSAKNIMNGDLDRFFMKITCHPTIVMFNNIQIMKRYLAAARRYFKYGLPGWYQHESKWYKENKVRYLEMNEWGRCYFKMVGDEDTELKSLEHYVESDSDKRIDQDHFLTGWDLDSLIKVPRYKALDIALQEAFLARSKRGNIVPDLRILQRRDRSFR